jgi:hypothetical protein
MLTVVYVYIIIAMQIDTAVPDPKVYKTWHIVRNKLLEMSQKNSNESLRLSDAAMQSVDLAKRELKERFQFIGQLLEFYLGPDTHNVKVSGLERMITRHALSHPSSFVHQVLFIIVPNAPYTLFTSQVCQHIYGLFVKSLKETTPNFPTLKTVFDSIYEDKRRLKNLGKEVVSAKIRHELHIHRLSDEHSVSLKKRHAAEGKLIIIDDQNYTKFPKSKYHHLSKKFVYVIRPTNEMVPQLHILVVGKDAPSCQELQERLRNDDEGLYTDEKWFIGGVAYNLFSSSSFLKKRLKEMGKQLAINVENRKRIRRGKKCASDDIMVGLGPRADRTGGVESDYINFKPNVDEKQKHLLEIGADRSMDFFAMVNLRFISSLIFRYLKSYFLVLLKHGMTKLGITLRYPLVSVGSL